MGKSRRGNKEFTREQKLLHENRQLRKRISQLHKQIARLDLDRYGNIKSLIEQHYQEDEAQEGREILDKVKAQWVCRECNSGHLEIILYTKANQTWYYRKCNQCTHRTASQKYTDDVKGIIKEATPIKNK